jgi:hypothetical protein
MDPIKLTNTSDHNVDCSMAYSNSLDRRYIYEVRTPAGSLVAKRARKHPEIGEPGSFYPCTINPGQSTRWNEEPVPRL